MNQQCIGQQEEMEQKESSFGKVLKVDGPLIFVEEMDGAEMFEIVKVGQKRLVGEIIKLDKNISYIQCFEDTSSLSVGDCVMRTKSPFLVELGPGIQTYPFDGIQRRLQWNENQFNISNNITGLDQDRIWEFKPSSKIKEGMMIFGGDIYGSVFENNLFEDHKILTSPKVQGRVCYIAPEGNYTLKDKVLEIELNGIKQQYGMSHFWPMRESRPILEKLQCNTPFLTDIRVLDVLYPTVFGGTCCASMSSLGGKLFLSKALTKYSKSDCHIYVGSGESESDIVSIIEELKEETLLKKDKEEMILQHLSLIANSSKMPTPTIEVSIYTGLTIAEYYRDMGLNVSLMMDSVTQWARAVNDIQMRIGDMNNQEEYPPILSQKLTQIYQRAGQIKCRGSPDREGSITFVGNVMQSEKHNDPVTIETINNSQVFWLLDKRLSQRKHFPHLNWILSNTKYEQQLESYFNSLNPKFQHLKTVLKQILNQEEQMIQQEAKDLSEDQKLTLEIALMIREDFLQQDTFSQYDDHCPLYKTISMMKCFVIFYQLAKQAILKSTEDNIITWSIIKNIANKLMYKLHVMKFYDLKNPQQELIDYFNNLADEIESTFKDIIDK
ncbi:unnamed protein product [Paramecium sonneborni]|uniref:H(+)-transporting two-sector ATPase n=1 Tax=Paramecium sonneborni TaxID=65129 RepID=A0A8S1QDT6_9CILI|nr:unnamed protein product [Paramecium sonneborni]